MQPGDITFEWALPGSEQNGVIQKFTISYAQEVSNPSLKYTYLYLKCIYFQINAAIEDSSLKMIKSAE